MNENDMAAMVRVCMAARVFVDAADGGSIGSDSPGRQDRRRLAMHSLEAAVRVMVLPADMVPVQKRDTEHGVRCYVDDGTVSTCYTIFQEGAQAEYRASRAKYDAWVAAGRPEPA